MDLCATPAVELARLIRARELSAAELLAAVLARIADANPAVNAIVTLAAGQAAAAAAALDAQAARGSFAGPLHGLPIAVKDLAETAGIRTPFGSPLSASDVPDFAAPDAALLLAGMCGTDPGLPMARPERPEEFLGLRPASLRGLRVAWTFDLGDLPVQPEVLAVLAACRRSLEDAGCAVTDAAPALADADEVFQVLRAARMARLAPLLRDHRDQVKATLAWNIEKGLALGGEQIAAARAGHAESFQAFSSFLADGGYEVLALPTAQVVPFPV